MAAYFNQKTKKWDANYIITFDRYSLGYLLFRASCERTSFD